MDNKRHLLLTIAYNGSRYHGFQYQHKVLTVQKELENHISKAFNEKIRIRGSSRTDAGVHAKGQKIQFETVNLGLPHERIKLILNRSLPRDIMIKEVEEVESDFNCISGAKSKTYTYTILNQEEPQVFVADYSWQFRAPLNFDLLQDSCKYFIGERDFASFESNGRQMKTSIRRINFCTWSRNNNQLTFTINGNGFLYHMVRNIVGTMIEVGRGKENLNKIPIIFHAKQRKFAGPTVPAHGLCLEKVFY